MVGGSSPSQVTKCESRLIKTISSAIRFVVRRDVGPNPSSRAKCLSSSVVETRVAFIFLKRVESLKEP